MSRFVFLDARVLKANRGSCQVLKMTKGSSPLVATSTYLQELPGRARYVKIKIVRRLVQVAPSPNQNNASFHVRHFPASCKTDRIVHNTSFNPTHFLSHGNSKTWQKSHCFPQAECSDNLFVSRLLTRTKNYIDLVVFTLWLIVNCEFPEKTCRKLPIYNRHEAAS